MTLAEALGFLESHFKSLENKTKKNRNLRKNRDLNVKEELTAIQETVESILSGLKRMKEAVELGQTPFVERDYFNLAVALERVQEAKERLAGILQRD
jgi:translation elongation factor EF-4